jgi:integrase
MPPKIKRLSGDQRHDAAVRRQHEEQVLARRRAVNESARQAGVRLNLYAFRHSRITEALVNGLDAVTVSVLAGHQDTTMLSRHYAHLTQKHEHLRQAARKATGS